MKSTVKSLAVFFVLCFVLIQDSSISGTADIATLAPSSAIILTGALQPISFSATNNKAYDIKTYHAEFSIPAGLTITDISTTPVATKATIDTRKNLLIFEWSAVGQGATVTGNFTVSAATQGMYTLAPATVFYTDYNRKTYNASCNSSAISMRDEFISPSSPRNIRSRTNEGYIAIFWDRPADTDVAGYNLYRRTAATDFVAIGQIAASPYADASVEDGTTYYYRVTAVDGSENESEWSAETSETYVKLFVQAYAAPGITIVAVGDINGDGQPDLVAGDPTYTLGNGGNAKYQVGKVAIYYGGNTSGIPDVTIVGENAEDQFGYALTVVDMNNDGFDELIIGAPYYDDLYAATWPFSGKATNGGKVYVYSGSSQLSATPVYTVEGKLSLGCNGSCLYLYAERLGFSMAAAGDVNNDGYQDVAIGAPMGGMDHSGRILVLFGRANLSSPDTAQVAGPRADFNLGCTVAPVGDVNGDGYGDLISGNTGGPIVSFSNKASLIYGGNYLSHVLEINAGSSGDGIAKVVSAAGDVNGDGYADFAVSRRIYYGGPYPDAIADRILPDAPDFLSLLGDINDDGFKDVLVSPGPKVYFGGVFAEYVPDIVREGVTVLAVNDVDRDGIRETFAGADANALYVYSLASLVTATLPDIVILSPKNNFSTDQSAVTVSGIVTGAITKLQVGGQYLPLQPDGTFAVLTPLSAGTNVIELNAETPAGKISKRWIAVKQAPPKPLTLSLSMMDGAVYTVDAPMMVSGTVSDVTATVVLNGVPANLYSDVSGIHFESAAVRLAEGRNTLTAIAQDGYGQTASVSVTVMLLTKGMLTGAVTDVATGLALPEVTVTVEGSQNTYTAITDAQGAYTQPGIAAGSFIVTFAKTGYFSQTSTGDIANGQVQTVNAQMTPLPPLFVSITAPQDGDLFNTSAITVTGNVTNNAAVVVNGMPATVSGGAYSARIPLHEGPNPITASALDEYGQTATDGITVTLSARADSWEIYVNQPALDFGSRYAGTSFLQNFYVSNIGSGNLVLGTVAQPAQPFPITSDDCSGRTLSPSASCIITVKFAPPSEGVFTRTLTIPSNDADNPNYTVTLTGTAAYHEGGYFLPDTGQQTCSGVYQRNPLSYTANADGTVLDANTGLVWQQTDDNLTRTWADAVNYCSGLTLGGQSGWRLPAGTELLGIVDYGRNHPAIDLLTFPGTDAAPYWSASEDGTNAWAVDFTAGGASVLNKTARAPVRCVRGTPLQNGPYSDNGDQTMTDLTTGLMWMKSMIVTPTSMDWALSTCNGAVIFGYSDWRLPTIKELSIYGSYCSMGDCTNWSSTALYNSACGQAYTMGIGVILAESKANQHMFQCVRGGNLKTVSPPPSISAIAVSAVTDNSATIAWTTDQPADSLVEYGTTASYGSLAFDQTSTTSHSITLTNLSPRTMYHFRVISANNSGASAVSGDNTFTSSFIVTTVGDYGNIAVMEVTGNYDAKNPDSTLNNFPRQEIAKEFIRTHQDQYDFLVIVSNFDFAMPDVNAKAFYLEVKNDTQGIAKTVFDNSAAFGSSGKLQGTIDMGNIADLGVNPLDPVKFETTLDTLAHEQLHRWGAGVKFKNPDGTLNNALFGKDDVHWSYLLDTDGSLEYGNDWKDNGDGTFTSVSASKYYSNLDLYLMGMIDKSLVSPMTLIENGSIAPTLLPSLGTTITGTVRTVTIDDIIAAEGERVPNTSTSQKTFKTGFIFITQTGTFDGSEPPAIETVRNAWAGRFASLTNGKGSISDVVSALTVTISSPSNGVTIMRPDTTVKGVVINSTGNETGVTVNGIVATVAGNQFIAEHVPLAEGANTISVTATDTAGTTMSTIIVNAATTGNYIRVTSNIESGIAPLEAILRVDGTFSITSSSINASGPASPEITVLGNAEYKVKTIAEGTYTFTVSATGPDGNTYQDTVTITVLNKTQLDTLLKAKWEGMKINLANQDITSAVSYFNSASQQLYNDLFTVANAQLPQLVQEMQDIQLIYVRNGTAKYRIIKNEIYGGQTLAITYYIYFALDESGMWKIAKF